MFNAEKQITNFLKPRGYKKTGSYWYKETDFHIYFLKMHGAKYGGPDRFIVLGFAIKELIHPGKTFKTAWLGGRRISAENELKGCLTYYHKNAELSDGERENALDRTLKCIVPELETYANLEVLLLLPSSVESKDLISKELIRRKDGAS